MLLRYVLLQLEKICIYCSCVDELNCAVEHSIKNFCFCMY
jgi:hypothetical protein